MGLETTEISSFAFGEIDPALQFRFSDAPYLKSCRQLKNFVVTSYGSALKRNGSKQYLNVSNNIGLSTKIKFFTQILSSPDSGVIFVGVLLVDQIINLQVLGPTGPIGTMQPIILQMTSEQAQEARFLSAQNSIVILHPNVATQRITFNGTTFAAAPFVYVRPPTFDLRQVNYFNDPVFIAGPTGGSNITNIHIQNTNFTTAWIGGAIVGPGPDDVSPFGAGKIVGVTVTATETIFEVLATSSFLTSSGYNTSALLGSNLSIQQVIFTDELGYPGDGVYYQNRLFLTGHPKLPVTIFGSQQGSADDFYVNIGLSTDAISYTMEQEDTGKILFLNVGKELQIFTQLAEYSAPIGLETGLTPSSFTLKWQSGNGISPNCLPTNFQTYSFFSGANGKTIYKIQEAGGVEQDFNVELISQFASHLINSPLKLTTFYSQDKSTIILTVLNSDNTMAFLSYNSSMDIMAWTPFTLNKDVQIVDIDSANNVLYLVVKYLKTGLYFIETIDFQNSVPVDSAIPINIPVSTTPPVITGLNSLNGYFAAISNGVNYLGSFFVKNGTITLDNPVETAFSGYVGLTFDAVLEPLYFITDPKYAYGHKILDALYINYLDSLAILVNGQLINFQKFKDLQKGAPLALKTGTAEMFIGGGWDRFRSIQITQEAPVGLHILSIAYRMTQGGL